MTSEVYKPTDEELALLKRWYAPDVSDNVDTRRTNALKMNVSQLGQPQEQEKKPVEELEVSTLSTQALEEITQQAHDQGYQDGLTKGKEEGLLQGHQAGYEQGVEQGVEDGMVKGLAQVQPEIEQRLALLDTLLDKFTNPLASQQQEVEKSLVQLSLTLARKVIHTEITQNNQPIIKAVSEGVKVIGQGHPVIISVNPVDVEVIESLWDEKQRLSKNLTIDGNVSLAVGDCLLETTTSSVSINLEERITQVFEDFSAKPQPEHEYVENSPSNEAIKQDINNKEDDNVNLRNESVDD